MHQFLRPVLAVLFVVNELPLNGTHEADRRALTSKVAL
jgi:hypothetical protein